MVLVEKPDRVLAGGMKSPEAQRLQPGAKKVPLPFFQRRRKSKAT
jgi:hypothetical protein